jgi:hypothetical protein
MSLSDILDRLQPWCPGWERTTGRKSLLSIVQQCLDRIYAIDHDSLIFRPGDENDNRGFPPYLITTAGQYKYAIDGANTLSCGAIFYTVPCLSGPSFSSTFIPRKVRRVLVDVSNLGYYEDGYYGNNIISPVQSPFGVIATTADRHSFAQVKVSTSSAMVSANSGYVPPTVTFQSDPGSTTEKYFVEFYIMPKRLTGDDDEIPLPIQFEQAIEDGTRGRVQELESGSPSPMLQKFEEFWMPKIHSEIFATETVRRTSTPPNYV